MTMKPARYAACEECEGLGRWYGSPLNSPESARWHTCAECGGDGKGRQIIEHDEDEEAGDDERI